MAPKILENDKSPWSGCSRKPVTRGFVVGVRGFEPPASTSRTTPFRPNMSQLVPTRAALAGVSRHQRPASHMLSQPVPDSLAPKMAPKIRPCEQRVEADRVRPRTRRGAGSADAHSPDPGQRRPEVGRGDFTARPGRRPVVGRGDRERNGMGAVSPPERAPRRVRVEGRVNTSA